MSKLRIPYAKAIHGQEEIDAVCRVLNTSTQMGEHTENFEQQVAHLLGKRYGIMVNSGSSANLLAVEILDLPVGGEVITPVLTFPTTVTPLIKNNLVPVFIDVDAETYCIDMNQVEAAINDKTCAMMIPNLLGNVADWPRLRAFADKHQLKLIDDSCDTLSATINGKPDGSYADVVTTSFYGSHIINCAGGGGLLATDDEVLANRAKMLRSWGRASSLLKEAESVDQRLSDEAAYDAKFLFSAQGYNLEPLEIAAAFGLEQLKRLPAFKAARQANFEKHQVFFKQYEEILTIPKQTPGSESAWISYPLTLKPNALVKRNQLQRYLEKQNIQTRPIFTGNILKQPGFTDIHCVQANHYPVADTITDNGILLGLHPALTDEMIQTIHEQFAYCFESMGAMKADV